jgi:3-ketoacyl-CoA synthase
LVTNSSLLNPTPSLSALIVNKFKMRSDIHSFSLGGMGCSAGLIGADMVGSFLQNTKMHYGLLISTENITHNFYKGEDKSMLLTNTLFRVGCAAVLFTNQKLGAKYEVVDLVRTHIGANDDAYLCINQVTDTQGFVGVSLQKSITTNATKALTKNMN